MNVQVMLYEKAYVSKPSNKEIGKIQNNLEVKEIALSELAEKVGAHGMTFKAAVLSGKTNDTWQSQQLFALDFDNGYTFDECIQFCNAYELKPCFAYQSFNHLVDKDGTGAKERFRLVFKVAQPITDARLRNAVQLGLMTCFSPDKACKDLTRMFFGGKGLLHYDEEALLSPAHLIGEVLPSVLKERDAKHCARDIKAFCQSVGLNMVNNLPSVTANVQDEGKVSDLVISPQSLYYNYRVCGQITKTEHFDFNLSTASNSKVNKKGEYSLQKVDIDNQKLDKQVIRNYDFDRLEQGCQFYREFVRGNFWPAYDQLKGIATNLCHVEGGIKKMTKALEQYENQYPSESSYNNAYNCIGNIAKRDYAPTRCENIDCPYYNCCTQDVTNMLSAGKNTSQLGIVETREDCLEYVDSEFAYDMALNAMSSYLLEPVDEKQKSMLMLIGPTGIGKTSMIRDLKEVHHIDFSNTVICLPSHKTVKDVFPRISTGDCLIAKELILEDQELMARYNHFRAIGNYKAARDCTQNFYMSLDMSQEEKDRVCRDSMKADIFWKTEKALRKTTSTIFCTHKKALHLNNRNMQTLIIDEDILMTCLFEQVTINEQEIAQAKAIAEKHHLKVILGSLNHLTDMYEQAKKEPMHVQKLKAKYLSDQEIKTFRREALDVNFDILNYLRIEQLAADKNGLVVTGSFVNEIPYNKVIVMSATASPSVYEYFLPTTEIEVHDMGNVINRGEIIHHHVGTSRYCMRSKGERLINQVKQEAPGVENIISFKDQEQALTEAGFNFICNFGNCTGIDAYKGQDLIVLGTPHVNSVTYLLLASTIKPNINIIEDFEMTEITRNGYRFSFNTFKNVDTETGQLLFDLQMYYIETELIQAIGRARALREDCKVHVFSNLPQRGSVLYTKK